MLVFGFDPPRAPTPYTSKDMPQLDRQEYSSLSRDHPNYHKKIARLIENKSRNNHEEEELQDALYRCKFNTGLAIQLDQEMSRRKHAITEQDKHMKGIYGHDYRQPEGYDPDMDYYNYMEALRAQKIKMERRKAFGEKFGTPYKPMNPSCVQPYCIPIYMNHYWGPFPPKR